MTWIFPFSLVSLPATASTNFRVVYLENLFQPVEWTMILWSFQVLMTLFIVPCSWNTLPILLYLDSFFYILVTSIETIIFYLF